MNDWRVAATLPMSAWRTCLCGAMALALALSLAQGGAAAGKDPAVGETQALMTPTSLPGEVIFAPPKSFAILLFRDSQVRRLYAAGDVLVPPGSRSSSVVIDRLSTDRIILRLGAARASVSIRRGQAMPGMPQAIFIGTVELTKLTYRFTLVDRVVVPEPVLASLSGGEAVLQKEVARLPALPRAGVLSERQRSGKASMAAAVERVRMRRVNGDIYEVDEASLAPLLQRVAEAVSGTRPPGNAAFFAFSAFGLPVSSDVGEGILSDTGFQITNLTVANTLGMRVGDTVVSLNGRTVISPLNAWWTLQDLLIRNHRLRDIRVKMLRDGELTTKLYVIR